MGGALVLALAVALTTTVSPDRAPLKASLAAYADQGVLAFGDAVFYGSAG